ncbi:SMI1/KNR4 family protein [Herbidospora mongoliensis]|uniref:SMI1/KNR4 family protein n=1 Tax=Herbidospora mongoliensis TaxID=688067 RepID=UPI000833AA47|nr:SMI1/KNR4 family protein [Herbidospora mongoliensis]
MTAWDDLLQLAGGPGVSEADLLLHEERLSVRLPPSYREFLMAADGWDPEKALAPRLRPVAEVRWARDVDPYLAEGWGDDDLPRVPDEEYFIYGPEQDCSLHFRPEYLPDTLCVSIWDDGQIVLLNPAIVFPDGEWEAWDLASWHPGAVRYRSFRELALDMYADETD